MKHVLLVALVVFFASPILQAEEKIPGMFPPPKPAVPQNVFTVFGQVAKHGTYEPPGDGSVTVTKAIEMAGGPTEKAKLKAVKLVRKKEDGKTVSILVNVQAILDGKPGAKVGDIRIRAGDIISVPEKLFP